jgi:hypothetical protein
VGSRWRDCRGAAIRASTRPAISRTTTASVRRESDANELLGISEQLVVTDFCDVVQAGEFYVFFNAVRMSGGEARPGREWLRGHAIRVT